MRRKTRLRRAVTCLLSPEQYATCTHPTPYTYSLQAGEAALCFVGAHHTNRADVALCAHIQDQFVRFAPTQVVVEGMQNLIGQHSASQLLNGLTLRDAIVRGGEAVFTIVNAKARGIPWHNPEPSDRALMRHLSGELYSSEQLVAWYTLRLLGQYHRRDEPLPFVAYVAPFLAYLASATGWDKKSCSLEQALATVRRTLGHEPNLHNAERTREYTDPIPWPQRWEQQTIFNDITRAALWFRDRRIVRRVGDMALRGERVLVVYGAGHAVMQEPAYRYLLNA